MENNTRLTLLNLPIRIWAIIFALFLFLAQFDLHAPNFYVVLFIIRAYAVELSVLALAAVGLLVWRDRAALTRLYRRFPVRIPVRLVAVTLGVAVITFAVAAATSKGERRRDLAPLKHPKEFIALWLRERHRLYGLGAITEFRDVMFDRATEALRDGHLDRAKAFVTAAKDFAPSLGRHGQDAEEAQAWLGSREAYIRNHLARVKFLSGTNDSLTPLGLWLLNTASALSPEDKELATQKKVVNTRVYSAFREAQDVLHTCFSGQMAGSISTDTIAILNPVIHSVGDLNQINSPADIDTWCQYAGDYVASIEQSPNRAYKEGFSIQNYYELYTQNLQITWGWLIHAENNVESAQTNTVSTTQP